MAGYYNESDPAVITILKWKSDGIAWLKYSYIMLLYILQKLWHYNSNDLKHGIFMVPKHPKTL